MESPALMATAAVSQDRVAGLGRRQTMARPVVTIRTATNTTAESRLTCSFSSLRGNSFAHGVHGGRRFLFISLHLCCHTKVCALCCYDTHLGRIHPGLGLVVFHILKKINQLYVSCIGMEPALLRMLPRIGQCRLSVVTASVGGAARK